MDVQVIIDYPPMFDEIDRAFNVRGKPVIFTWGMRVFNPMGVPVAREIIHHEAVHSERQNDSMGRDDEAKIRRWWERYLVDPEFRLIEEIEAHKAEYRALANTTKDRNRRSRYLAHVAGKLAAPLYGSLITPREAARQIQGARA